MRNKVLSITLALILMLAIVGTVGARIIVEDDVDISTPTVHLPVADTPTMTAIPTMTATSAPDSASNLVSPLETPESATNTPPSLELHVEFPQSPLATPEE